MVFSCFAVYLQEGGPYTTQNMVQPVHDYPRRYTAKQLKTIYYSLIKTYSHTNKLPYLETELECTKMSTNTNDFSHS